MRKTLFPLLALCLLLSGCGETPAADASAEFFAMDTVMRLETPGLSDPAAVTAGRDAVEALEDASPGRTERARSPASTGRTGGRRPSPTPPPPCWRRPGTTASRRTVPLTPPSPR